MSKITGYITFLNIIIIVAAIMITIGAGWLFCLYLLPLFKDIPPTVYEVMVYLACIFLMAFGSYFAGNTSVFVALLGCLGLILALTLTHILHEDSMETFYNKIKIKPETLLSLIVFIAWSGVAIYYQSVLIGFMSIIALQAFLGFSAAVVPFGYVIGFKEEEVIPRAMGASFLLIAFYSIVRILDLNIPYFHIFSTGALFMGTFVYFLGLLIICNKWYPHEDGGHYAIHQILAVASGIAALAIGSIFAISQLQQIGGTFFFLYLIEKYTEIPFSKHWGWFIFILGGLLYLGGLFMSSHPEYFYGF